MTQESVRLRSVAYALLVVVPLVGCQVFDESLLEQDAPGSASTLVISDALTCDAPANQSLNDYRSIDTSALDNNLSMLPSCLGEASAPGNDTFFAVDMIAGEKWHFHVQVSSEALDPVIYVLDSCSDSRSCRNADWGIDACATGENEHFSFVPPADGRYYVAIDSLTGGGEPLEVFAVRAECGNLQKEHSEFCDDGNDDPEDGCHECRPVLLGSSAETEPNDGPLDPNIIRITDGFGLARISGTLGTRCDFDFFQVTIPEASRVTLTAVGATDCGHLDLQLRKPTDPNHFVVQAPEPGASCAAVEEAELDPGSYVIRVASRREPGLKSAVLDYEFELRVDPLESTSE